MRKKSIRQHSRRMLFVMLKITDEESDHIQLSKSCPAAFVYPAELCQKSSL